MSVTTGVSSQLSQIFDNTELFDDPGLRALDITLQ